MMMPSFSMYCIFHVIYNYSLAYERKNTYMHERRICSDMINCPNYQSEHVQRFEMIYESGFSNVKIDTSATTFGSGGTNFTGGKSKGVSQTALSQRTSPPEKDPYSDPFCLAIFCRLVLWVIAWKYQLSWLSKVSNLVCFGIFAYSMFYTIKFNFSTWPKLMDNWQKRFLCHKCGYSFLVEE